MMAAETPEERAKDIKRSLSCLHCGVTEARRRRWRVGVEDPRAPHPRSPELTHLPASRVDVEDPPHPHLLGLPQSQTPRLPQLQISHLTQKQRQVQLQL
jgi:hypothetical protein